MKPMDARRQKRMNKDFQEKKLKSLWDRKCKLDRGKHYDYVELPKPIRAGYKRFFVLRDDIARSTKEAAIYKPLLKWMNTVVRSSNKKFMVKQWRRKNYVPITQGLHVISHSDWNKKVEPTLTLKQKSLFMKVWHPNTARRNGKTINAPGGEWKYIFTKPWVFVYKIEPYYHTHRILVNPQIESELKEIWNKIDTNNLWPKLYKQWGGRTYFDYDWESTWDRIIRKLYDREAGMEKKEYLSDPLGEERYFQYTGEYA